MDLKTAAAYIRVSTDDQTEYSPDAQLRELREYAAAHGMLLDERFVYADEGISGRKAERRPAFMEMIRTAKLKEHPFDVVLVHKFDRFARSREDSVVYKAMLKRCGVDVISIKEPIAEGNYSGVMEAIYESFAEAYSINLGQEVKKGMTEKALRGQPQTAPPYGYMLGFPGVPPRPFPSWEGGAAAPDEGQGSLSQKGAAERSEAEGSSRTFVPHPEEAPYVREIFRRFADGEGLFPLAKWMNACGQRTHRGGMFENRTIEYILRNPIYVGKVRWNPKRRTRRDFTDPDLIIADGTHEPLIDRALWDRAQERMAEVKARWKYHGRPTYDRKYWLSGIVRCSACGGTLIWANPCYFKCSNYAKGRCRSSQHVRADLLAEAVIERLRVDATLPTMPEVRLIPRQDETEQQLRLLRRQLEASERKARRLLDAYLGGAEIPIEQFNGMLAGFRAEAEELRGKISELEESRPATDALALLRASIQNTLTVLEDDAAPTETKYAAASSLLESAVFNKQANELTLTYRLYL